MISRILGIGCLTSICLPTAWAADCPNRQPGQHLEFLGRSADNSVSLWLSSPGSGGNFRLSAPGVSEIDSWNANRASLHLSVSPVVLDDLNGTHKLDLLNADGSFNCFFDSRNQNNPVFPNIPPIDGGDSNGGTGGGTGGGDGSNGGSGGGTGGGSDPIRNIVTSISADALMGYLSGSLSISDRVVVGLDQFEDIASQKGLWQVWTDVRHTGVSDDRNEIDTSGHANSFLIGIHRSLGKDGLGGIAFANSKTSLGTFGSSVRNEGDSFFVGPYGGYRLDTHWLLDGWAAWGRTDNDTELDVLKGSFKTTTGLISANLTGGYDVGEYLLRPKLALFYSHNKSDAFDYTGSLPYANQIYNVTLRVNENSFEYATSEASGDISRIFTTTDGVQIIPALRLGVRYDIERPNDGQILNENLTMESTTPWSGSARIALAVAPQRHQRFEVITGYYSIGRQELDLWDIRFNAAVNF
ncbi:autotransporter outer membrane beta-barrel domain-containing protein [Aeromonas veronii]|uniref:autotransporter outer membrane beta-barrel domain-containing protein n=1 Tax=Aeromonas TaxID=642 RepID=UPI0022EA2DDB|nr:MULTISPECIES: autotransporter outer membrane beta-barrel domain-containing protein [Aeromonas]KAJ8738583.1 autotransporter outer membrane beta-barrel domain-containing protein [Aeromonas veronii]MDA3317036.1 autotransporter outer membrane beta-barrel domain-containing protein [Aeromonas sp. PI_26]